MLKCTLFFKKPPYFGKNGPFCSVNTLGDLISSIVSKIKFRLKWPLLFVNQRNPCNKVGFGHTK